MVTQLSMQRSLYFLGDTSDSTHPADAGRRLRCRLRHRLGLSRMPPGAPVVACYCLDRPMPTPPDHATVCKACTKGVTLRHNILGVSRQITVRAGIATAIEPAMSRLRAQDVQPTCERATCLQCCKAQGRWSPAYPLFIPPQAPTGGRPFLPTVRRLPPRTKRSGRNMGWAHTGHCLASLGSQRRPMARCVSQLTTSPRNWPRRRPPRHRPGQR
jgi:hypothetical protein